MGWSPNDLCLHKTNTIVYIWMAEVTLDSLLVKTVGKNNKVEIRRPWQNVRKNCIFFRLGSCSKCYDALEDNLSNSAKMKIKRFSCVLFVDRILNCYFFTMTFGRRALKEAVECSMLHMYELPKQFIAASLIKHVGMCALRYEAWSVKCEAWSVNHKTWSLKREAWRMEREIWSMKHKAWSMKLEAWSM